MSRIPIYYCFSDLKSFVDLVRIIKQTCFAWFWDVRCINHNKQNRVLVQVEDHLSFRSHRKPLCFFTLSHPKNQKNTWLEPTLKCLEKKLSTFCCPKFWTKPNNPEIQKLANSLLNFGGVVVSFLVIEEAITLHLTNPSYTHPPRCCWTKVVQCLQPKTSRGWWMWVF